MKVVAKPIEMIAMFSQDGVPTPIRFRLHNGEEGIAEVIKVDRVITKDSEKLAGNRRIIFNCQSCINGIQRMYQLKYEIDTCKWILFKI